MGPNMICRLCLQEKPLVESHIIPEFCYKPIYDHKHRLNELSTDPGVPNRCRLQKGLKENLLCSSCDNDRISKWENYARKVFYGGVEIGITPGKDHLIISEVDYKKMKLFQMSVLFRASVSKHKVFKDVNLGVHEERLRRMLIDEDPGEIHRYGCAMLMIVTAVGQPKGQADVVDGIIIEPERIKVGGQNGYAFIFGGCVWMYIVSSNSEKFPNKNILLQKDGTLTLGLVDPKSVPYIRNLATKLTAQGKVPRRL